MNAPQETIDIDQTVRAVVLQLLQRRVGESASICAADNLIDSGLMSIDLAQIVAILENKLALDPFGELVSITSIQTLGDLTRAYHQAQNGVADDVISSKVNAGVDRAEQRRRQLNRGRN